MKMLLKKRIAIIFFILFALACFQVLFVFLNFSQEKSLIVIKSEVLKIMATFLFIQFAIIIISISYLPNYLRKLMGGVRSIINEISQGSYNYDIDLEAQKKLYDKEVYEVIEAAKKMLEIILKFDSLKKEKIQEQRGRIVALLNLTENGFIVVNRKGEIVYINYLISEHFPTIKEHVNIIETNFGLEIDNNIKKFITAVIKNQSKFPPKQFYMSSMKRHIKVKSELVRDDDGEFIGTVIGIFNLSSKTADQDKEKSTNDKKQSQ
jgi:signal transduction histidine kinase